MDILLGLFKMYQYLSLSFAQGSVLKSPVVEVIDILSIQYSNVSICGDVYVAFNDSLFEHT